MRPTGVETQIPDGVACEGLDDPKAVHVPVHAMEVPESDVIVGSPCGHSVTFGVNDAARDCFVVASQGGILLDRHSELLPLGFLWDWFW